MFSRFTWVPVVLFLGWAAVSQHWYVCYIQQACNTAEPSSVASATTVDTRPLVFRQGAAMAIPQSAFPAFLKATLDGLKDDQLLEIVGLYYPDEKAPEGFANLGLARAAQVKALFVPPLAPERVVLTSRLVDKLPAGEPDNGLITAVDFQTRAQPAKSSIEIVEKDDKIAILFPSGSIRQEDAGRVDDYLAGLAQRLLKSGESIVIIGHTDNSGTPETNIVVGQRRADHIRDILMSKGLGADHIKTASEGETRPVAGNDTAEGRRQNRRVELQLVKP